ncbi:MAG: lamin tail domain-containing protein [Candidatus Vogelbacteria bacterium]|nr:lamin tail domain-containing protein [Candidatus Vogelbacteria bacterium]
MNRMALAFLIVLSLLTVPRAVSANVFVNEIAWMGTAVSASDEWIELRNDSASAVSLAGWTLSWDIETANPRRVELAGTIAGNGYFLLERTDDGTLPQIVADQVYAGALDNGGEDIVLKDSGGAEVERVSFLVDGWPAGDNTTKDTMQKSASAWITASGTPRAMNALSSPPSSTEEVSNTGGPSAVVAVSAHSSPANVVAVRPKEDFAISAGRNRIASVGEHVRFAARGIGASERFEYFWSFGDGSFARGRETDHAYAYPGTYNVVINAERGEDISVARNTVTVFAPAITIAIASNGMADRSLELHNTGPYEQNLADWAITVGGTRFQFPRDTIISAGMRIILPWRVHGLHFEEDSEILLSRPDGVRADIYRKGSSNVSVAEPTSEDRDSAEIREAYADLQTAHALILQLSEHVTRLGAGNLDSRTSTVPLTDVRPVAVSTAAVEEAVLKRDAPELGAVTKTPSRTVIPKRDSGIIGIIGRIGSFLRALIPGQ